jgi:hypothetical protein
MSEVFLMKILEKATITYADGLKEYFEAIRITEKGVRICRVIDGEYLDYGFISKDNIKQIKNGSRSKIYRF